MSTAAKEKEDARAMPPPPIPDNKSAQPKILQTEFEALGSCLRDAIIKTGQIYKFHAETRRLGIANHVATPPTSLTAGLGRDIERYDQLCDSIEAQIVRAINVLKRDLKREEQRKEEEAKRQLAEASKLPPSEPMIEDAKINSQLEGDNRMSPTTSTTPLGRRPSAISISSLHRPQFPLKLDLSSTSLKFTEEEAMSFQKGLASPVTLAPKSARPVGPNEFPPDFMAAFAAGTLPHDVAAGTAAIDLTLSENSHIPGDHPSIGLGLGGSSDKPIDLDLDLDNMDVDMANMTDLFGDTAEPSEGTNADDGLFSPPDMPSTAGQAKDTLADFAMGSNVNTELFGDFSQSTQDTLSTDGPPTMPNDLSAPSPGTMLLAQLSSTSKPSTTAGGENFDLGTIDLTLEDNFFTDTQNPDMNFNQMDMDSFLGMDSGITIKKEEI